jgi:hypothetical protein
VTPGFSERTFEFCFNSEYCRANAALLASHPHLPSQQIEKDLGYDVEFQINNGHFTRSLFLQHKVTAFAEVRAGRNAHFFAAHNGPYYRFSVDNHQHNTLHRLSQTKGNAFYCAPRFHLRSELEGHFFGSTISVNSVLLNPTHVGRITDTDRHNITFDPLGGNATLHSETRRFSKSFTGEAVNHPEVRRVKVDEGYIEELSALLVEETATRRFEPLTTHAFRHRRPIQKAQILLAHVYDVTWLLLP